MEPQPPADAGRATQESSESPEQRDPLTILRQMRENVGQGTKMDVPALFSDIQALDALGTIKEKPAVAKLLQALGADPVISTGVIDYLRAGDLQDPAVRSDLSEHLKAVKLLGMEEHPDIISFRAELHVKLSEKSQTPPPSAEEQAVPAPPAIPLLPIEPSIAKVVPPPTEEYRLSPNPGRNAVLVEIPDAEAREILGVGIPRGELRPYTHHSSLRMDRRFDKWREWNPQEKFLDLMRRQAKVQKAGQFYRDVFALAASSQDPIELQNAFGTLEAVSTDAFYTGDLNQEDQSLINGAQEAFLQTTITPQGSPQAGELARNIFAEWSGQTFHTGDTVYNIFKRIFRQTSYNEMFANLTPTEETPFFAETFFYLVLNRDLPIEFRQTVLNYIPFVFRCGDLDREEDTHKIKPFFNKEASFFTSVDVSWIYPHMAHLKRGATADRSVLDVESLGEAYDNLKARAIALESSLRQADTNLAQAIKDKEELQRVVDQLTNLAQGRKGMSDEEREAAGYYKEFGGHPLSVLDIGTVYWRDWTADQRHTQLMRAYRVKVRQYHYDVPRQDPSYDEMKSQLMTAVLARVTNAFNYLDKNRTRAEFPDLRT